MRKIESSRNNRNVRSFLRSFFSGCFDFVQHLYNGTICFRQLFQLFQILFGYLVRGCRGSVLVLPFVLHLI